MPAEPAPGQAAYEAHAAMVVPRPWRWDQLDGKLRAAWDAAAHAAIDARITASDDGTLTAAGRVADLLDERRQHTAEIASLREQLAEQSRQRDGLLGRVNDLAADVEALQDDNASLREQLDRLRIAGTELRGELDDLASHWEHAGQPDGLTRDETWEQEGRRGCARELREALEGGGDGD